MNTKKIGFLLSLFLIGFKLHANPSSDIWIAELQDKAKTIETKQCPKGHDIDNIDWVKQKINCMFEIDQVFANAAAGKDNYNKLKNYLNEITRKNEKTLSEILSKHGWPVISKFGKTVDERAWLIVQHSDHDPNFQSAIAFLLGQLVELGETSSKNYAYLYDRAALKYSDLGLKQKYGTQFKINESGDDLTLLPYVGTIEEVNARRKSVGLKPVQRYLNKSKAMILK